MPSLDGVLETALYVDNLNRSIEFYRNVFELKTLAADDRFCALAVAGRQVLLLFRKRGSIKPIPVQGGTIPPHDGDGQLHMAFAISTSELSAWERRLREKGIAIESKVTWPRGGLSLYFRDPDNHVIELATPGIWAIY
jgi:catechol 2,3-dioxygenase-like lactoylglutathione lyase family enzyme